MAKVNVWKFPLVHPFEHSKWLAKYCLWVYMYKFENGFVGSPYQPTFKCSQLGRAKFQLWSFLAQANKYSKSAPSPIVASFQAPEISLENNVS